MRRALKSSQLVTSGSVLFRIPLYRALHHDAADPVSRRDAMATRACLGVSQRRKQVSICRHQEWTSRVSLSLRPEKYCGLTNFIIGPRSAGEKIDSSSSSSVFFGRRSDMILE